MCYVPIECRSSKVLLAAKVVIERPVRHVRGLQNVAQPGCDVTMLVHQLLVDIDQVVARRFRAHSGSSVLSASDQPAIP